MQAKLLAALQNREVTRLGSNRKIPVDIRLIAATNRNLPEMVAQSLFREDLFYRINTVEIHIPPLRERGEDIQLLADHFLWTYARKYKKDIRQIARDARGKLQRYAWPGNVRELRNVIERALIICDDYITLDDMPLDFRSSTLSGSAADGDDFELAEAEHRHIQRVLQYTKGNKAEAARLLKIGLTTLYRKIEEYGINI